MQEGKKKSRIRPCNFERQSRREITVLCPFASEFDKDMALGDIWFQKIWVNEEKRKEQKPFLMGSVSAFTCGLYRQVVSNKVRLLMPG